MTTPVTKQEIVDALHLAGLNMGGMNPLAERIKQHGIAQEPNIQQLIAELRKLARYADSDDAIEDMQAIISKYEV